MSGKETLRQGFKKVLYLLLCSVIILGITAGIHAQEPHDPCTVLRADAGPNQEVPEGVPVLLDGSGSCTPSGLTLSYTWSENGTELGTGVSMMHVFEPGEHTVTLTVSDGLGEDTDEITVIDTTPPEITCPADVTLECSADTTPSATGEAEAHDTGSDVTLTFSDTSIPGCGNTETITRTWTATDEAGNSTSCEQVITVIDTTPPQIMDSPPDITVQCEDEIPVLDPSLITAIDNCGIVTIIYLGDEDDGNTCPRTITRRYRATDECGNSIDVARMIVIDDTVAPIMDCPSDVTIEEGESTDPTHTGTPIVTDNCSDSSSVSYHDNMISTDPEMIARTWTATDICGNSSTCIQTITITDMIPPTITCPADLILECPADTDPASTGEAIASDASGEVVISYSDTMIPECGNTRTIFRTWTATDAGGNQSSCVQKIAEADTTVPMIIIHSPVEGETILSTQGTILADFEVKDACDDSPTITITLDGNPLTGTLIDVRDLSQGSHTLCIAATDDCDNSRSECVTFFVEEAPMACFELRRMFLFFSRRNPDRFPFANSFRLNGEFLLPPGLTIGELAGQVEVIIEVGGTICSEKVQIEPMGENRWRYRRNSSTSINAENMEINRLRIEWSNEPSQTANTFRISGGLATGLSNDGSGIMSMTVLLPVLSGGDLAGMDTIESRVWRRFWFFISGRNEDRCLGPVDGGPDPDIVIYSPSETSTTQEAEVEITGAITSEVGILEAVAEINGVPHAIPLDEDGEFSILLPLLTEGGDNPAAVQNEIIIRAINIEGDEAERILTVLYIHEYEQGVVIVQFEEGTPMSVVEALNAPIGAVIRDHIEILDMYLIELPDGISVPDAITYYTDKPGIIFGEPNYHVKPDLVPNDPLHSWWKQTSLGARWYLGGFERAWDTATGIPIIVVAVVDSGLDHTHPDLIDNLWVNQGELPPGLVASGDVDGDGLVTLRDANLLAGRPIFAGFGIVDTNANGLIDGADLLAALINGQDDDGNGWIDDLIGYSMTNIPANGQIPNPDPMDCIGPCLAQGHGTSVSGIIGATGNNNLGVSGMMWRVRIMPLRVEDATTGMFNTWGITMAMTYAAQQGVRIANNSFSLYTPQIPQAWFGANGAYNLADSVGMLICCSAGNRGLNTDLIPHWPGNLSTQLNGVIQVAGLNANWDLANTQVDFYNTNFGVNTVNIAAPGTSSMVYTTRVTTRTTSPGGIAQLAAIGYGQFFGTSSATPHVAATAGLVLSVNPNLSGPAIRRCVLGPGGPGFDGMTWIGQIQGNRMLYPVGSIWFAQQSILPRQVVTTLGEYVPYPGFQASDVRLFDPWQAYAQIGSFTLLGQPTPGVGIETSAGDVDGDRIDDLIFGYNTPAIGFSLLVTDKSGTLKAQERFNNWNATIALYGTIAIGQFMGGANSIIVIVTPRRNIEAYSYNANRPLNQRLRIWQNLGTTFSWRAAVAAGDVDFDGWDELAIAEPEITGQVASYVDIRKVSNQGLGATMARITPYTLGAVTRMDIAIGDLDGDGSAELITLPVEGLGPIKIYNASGTQLSQFGSYGGSPALGEGQRITTGDVDNDGMDEVIIGGYAGLVEVYDWQPYFGSPIAVRTSTIFSAYGSGCPVAARVAVSK